MKTPEAIDRALKRGATHIGFIFFEKSPRYIEPDLAGKLAEPARGKAKIVAVVVDPTNDELDEIVSLLKPDILQLHGNESPEHVLTIKALYGLPVMKVFSVRTADDLKRVEAYIGIADRFLFDAKAPKGSELPGGNGISFDWSLLSWLDGSIDYMLSGGLNKDNVADALVKTKARGIDVSSGVETAPGVKSVAMIDEFFDAVEEADAPVMASGS
ncbi:phosphoribosylanthranilate isomerase [Rhizobium leguminosarum]|uniref:N-(5'-phosphoribosyl)anthranilate isomerase n=1 Tax=Rhizobium leguminosarum TaxID=384 RepID=A0A7Z0DZW5_RHILE|nr:phosphoribosylanthranilate isomerase [Rhizobium leguminosarum]